MTNLLKLLLHNYGLLFITVVQLQEERPGTEHASLQEYYQSLGDAEPGEPVLAVKISKDGEQRFIKKADPGSIGHQHEHGDLTVMELPEDEFYFFRAFRVGLFDLQKQLPSFLFQMALIYGYTLFETYLADVIRLRFSTHPALLGMEKHVSLRDVLENKSKDTLLEMIIDRELVRIMHDPIGTILERLRKTFGLRSLTTEYDPKITKLSLIRNCLIHNSAKVDQKLSKIDSSLSVGNAIDVDATTVLSAIGELRKFAYKIDTALERLELQADGDNLR